MSTVIIILVLVFAFNERLRRPVATLTQTMYHRGEAKYVKQETAINVPNGLRLAAAVAGTPGNVRLGPFLKRSRKEGFLARTLAGINGSVPVHHVEDLESKASAT